jgi:hypothetical protein
MGDLCGMRTFKKNGIHITFWCLHDLHLRWFCAITP